jgi:signal peptidase I
MQTPLSNLHDNVESGRGAMLSEMTLELLSRKFSMTFLTYGGSMNPLIVDGAIVEVIYWPIDQLKVGDVVLLKQEQSMKKFLMHRIIQIENNKDEALIYTKGDASPKDVQCFKAETFAGKLVKIVTGPKQYDMQYWIWTLINPIVTFFSQLSGYLSNYIHIPSDKKGLPFFFQKLINSLLKLFVYLGKRVSESKCYPQKSLMSEILISKSE